MNDSNTNMTGIVLMCVAMGLFAANDTLVKLISETLSAPQILLLRGVFVCAFTLVWVIAAGYGRSIAQIRNPRVLLRSGLEAFAGITYFIALANMQIAELTAVLLIAPLLIAAGAAVFYNEKISFGGWLAVAVGFIGMLLIVQPGTDHFSGYTLLGLASAVAIAGRDLITRKINTDVSSLVVCLAGGVALTLLGLI
ncbi:MAG: EamA family transporter, partial [Pseudomonadota bacterium]